MNDDHEKKYWVEHVEIYHEEDTIEPPPPDLVSKFNTIHEWLENVCDNEDPATVIATYNFGLFESQDGYILFLVGINTTEREKNHSITQIEFKPENTYFPLPETEFINLLRAQVVESITVHLKKFLKTNIFKRSFLAKARSITTDFAGEIWLNDGS